MWSHDQEIWLFNEVRLNNERALYQLYMISYDRLFRYGLHITMDKTVAMDCINEVFTDLWTKRGRLPQVDKVMGYLFIIFKRKLAHRVHPSKMEVSVAADSFVSLTQPDPSYEDLLVALQTQEETKQLLRHALDKLTPRQKELIRRRYFEEMTLGEIAEKDHISLRTVYNTLYTAMTSLRKELLKGGPF